MNSFVKEIQIELPSHKERKDAQTRTRMGLRIARNIFEYENYLNPDSLQTFSEKRLDPVDIRMSREDRAFYWHLYHDFVASSFAGSPRFITDYLEKIHFSVLKVFDSRLIRADSLMRAGVNPGVDLNQGSIKVWFVVKGEGKFLMDLKDVTLEVAEEVGLLCPEDEALRCEDREIFVLTDAIWNRHANRNNPNVQPMEELPTDVILPYFY